MTILFYHFCDTKHRIYFGVNKGYAHISFKSALNNRWERAKIISTENMYMIKMLTLNMSLNYFLQLAQDINTSNLKQKQDTMLEQGNKVEVRDHNMQ